jgi:amino acid transporter
VKQELKRVLTFADLLIYGMLFMVVIAPMSVFGYVSRESHGMAPLVYLIGMVAMFFTASSYVEMSRHFPRAGSVYTYVREAVNSHWGFLAGWLILLDYLFLPSLLYLLTSIFCVALFPAIPGWAWIIAFVLLNSVINVVGIEYTARSGKAMLAAELAVLGLFLLCGAVFVAGGGGSGSFTLTPFYQAGRINLPFLASACSIAALGFLGFDAISTLSEEAIDPERTVGRATLAALLVVGGLFVVQTYIAALIVPDYAAMNAKTAYFDAGASAGGTWLKILMLGVSIMATGIANAMTSQAATARILFSISRDGLLPAFLAGVHPRFKTPHRATLTVAALSLLCSLALDVELIIKLVNFGAVTAFILLNFAVFWFFFVRKRRRGARACFAYLLAPLTGIFILAFIWTGFDSVTKTVGLCWALAGLLYSAVYRRIRREAPQMLDRLDL